MEFKLNKIDTDIRDKIHESTKTDKIHETNKESGINKLKDYDEYKDTNRKNKENNSSKKKYITIDGIKYENTSIKIKAERLETINEENSKGRILDAKK